MATSKAVPSNGFAVSPTLEPRLREKIQELLLNMHLDPQGSKKLNKFGAQKFIVTSDDHYQPCYKMLENAGLDLPNQKIF